MIADRGMTDVEETEMDMDREAPQPKAAESAVTDSKSTSPQVAIRSLFPETWLWTNTVTG